VPYLGEGFGVPGAGLSKTQEFVVALTVFRFEALQSVPVTKTLPQRLLVRPMVVCLRGVVATHTQGERHHSSQLRNDLYNEVPFGVLGFLRATSHMSQEP
jgi:hypothetical protein